jgi:hypothetical protein
LVNVTTIATKTSMEGENVGSALMKYRDHEVVDDAFEWCQKLLVHL